MREGNLDGLWSGWKRKKGLRRDVEEPRVFAADSRLLGFFLRRVRGRGRDRGERCLFFSSVLFLFLGEIEGINWER